MAIKNIVISQFDTLGSDLLPVLHTLAWFIYKTLLYVYLLPFFDCFVSVKILGSCSGINPECLSRCPEADLCPIDGNKLGDKLTTLKLTNPSSSSTSDGEK